MPQVGVLRLGAAGGGSWAAAAAATAAAAPTAEPLARTIHARSANDASSEQRRAGRVARDNRGGETGWPAAVAVDKAAAALGAAATGTDRDGGGGGRPCCARATSAGGGGARLPSRSRTPLRW